jgi:hypothetical protein
VDPKSEVPKFDQLFGTPLMESLTQRCSLIQLTALIGWAAIDRIVAELFQSKRGANDTPPHWRSAASAVAYDLSDEEAIQN